MFEEIKKRLKKNINPDNIVGKILIEHNEDLIFVSPQENKFLSYLPSINKEYLGKILPSRQ